MAHFEIFCFCQLAAEKEGLSGENWRLPQTRDRKVTIYEIYVTWFIHIREGFYSYQLFLAVLPALHKKEAYPTKIKNGSGSDLIF